MSAPRLGLRENLPQLALLVGINALVGAVIGMERGVLPAIAQEELGLGAKVGMLSFIVVFGLSKAITNYVAGRLAEVWGRRPTLIVGWIVALPVPPLLMFAPSWGWILAANALLGVSQGLTWSTTVIMKVDLAGPKRRGLAMGLNELAGYLAVAASALVTGWLAERHGLRPEPFLLGVIYVALGLGLSWGLVRETSGHAALEAGLTPAAAAEETPSPREVLWRATLTDPTLSSVTQAGLVNNLNDGAAWGLFPLVFAAAGLGLAEIGALVALYPAVWGLTQLLTGALSDRVGRKGLIVLGMWTQALGVAVVLTGATIPRFALGQALLGLGTAMVYPTFLAAIGDVARPSWRASAMGVFRLWRDLGYAVGALLAGLVADAFGLSAALWVVAALTAASGLIVALRMRETAPGR